MALRAHHRIHIPSILLLAFYFQHLHRLRFKQSLVNGTLALELYTAQHTLSIGLPIMPSDLLHCIFCHIITCMHRMLSPSRVQRNEH